MAKLNEFLGGVLSSISNARVNSDVQSIRIADEYAKSDLLKHFSVPRMRIDRVEVNIPVAIRELDETTQKIYDPIDNIEFSSIAYQQVLRSLQVTKLPRVESQKLKSAIAEETRMTETLINANQVEKALMDFSAKISVKAIESFKSISTRKVERVISKNTQRELRSRIAKDLYETLKPEIRFNSEKKQFENFEVDVESHKLQEVSPENRLMIKMTISEQGMEWINLENNDGELVTKLMPE